MAGLISLRRPASHSPTPGAPLALQKGCPSACIRHLLLYWYVMWFKFVPPLRQVQSVGKPLGVEAKAGKAVVWRKRGGRRERANRIALHQRWVYRMIFGGSCEQVFEMGVFVYWNISTSNWAGCHDHRVACSTPVLYTLTLEMHATVQNHMVFNYTM